MGININARRIFDILAAGGILLLLTSLGTGQPEAADWGWDLIILATLGFIIYILITRVLANLEW